MEHTSSKNGSQAAKEFTRLTPEERERGLELLRQYEAELGSEAPPLSKPINPADIVTMHILPLPGMTPEENSDKELDDWEILHRLDEELGPSRMQPVTIDSSQIISAYVVPAPEERVVKKEG